MSKIFISHASEDKEAVAVPLAERLKERGLDVWLDQWELALGDGLRSSIETALSQAPFGIVILSPSYMRKKWPNRELDGLFSLETKDRKVILPVLHNIRLDELTQNLYTRGRCFNVDNISRIPLLNLPRRARKDAPGALHHIVIRRIERKAIFKDDRDREYFIERLSSLLQEMDTDAIRSVFGHSRCVPLSWHRREGAGPPV